MKEYTKQYEDFYKPNKNFLREKKISLANGWTRTFYQNKFANVWFKWQKQTFDFIVKIEWMKRQFCYEGYRWRPAVRHGYRMDLAYALFFKFYVNIDPAFYGRTWISRIGDYLDDFFPNFDQGNPFEGKYEYPYRYMHFEHLYLIHLLEERMDLLAIGEKRGMKYVEFFNYVMNHIMCKNEEGEDPYIYSLNWKSMIPSYIARISREKYLAKHKTERKINNMKSYEESQIKTDNFSQPREIQE